MEINFLAVLVAALTSFVVGFVWYNPKVFGTIWMKETGMTDEKARQGNMAKIFGLTFVFSFMLALIMMPLTIHQF
jgi:maltodextrin utilization protein YvdJ